jgi:hypothetical protein
MDRRKFFEEIIRYLILIVIGIVSGAALIKGRNVQAGSCPPELICQRCRKVNECTLPEKDEKDML